MRRLLTVAAALAIALAVVIGAAWALVRVSVRGDSHPSAASSTASPPPSSTAAPSSSGTTRPSSPAPSPAPSPVSTAGPQPPADAFPATVMWVSDGDTIGAKTADRTEIHVRLIGIDAPETKKPNSPVECFGPEASAELKRLLPKGSTITAAYQGFRVDKYRRDLWDIWLPDGRFVQGVMVAGGYARTLTFGGTNRDARYLAALQATAQRDRTGLWGACPS